MKPIYDLCRLHELIGQALRGDGGQHPVFLRELSRKTDIPVASMSNYLPPPAGLGTEPRLLALAKLSKYFGVTIAELLGEIDETDGQILKIIRKMNIKQKKAFLEDLKEYHRNDWIWDK